MLSSYEQDRHANIARNKAMLESLGIDKSVKRAPVKRLRKPVLQPPRRSSRVDAVTEVRARILQGMENDEERIEREHRQLLKQIRENERNERRELSQMRQEEKAQRSMAKLIQQEKKRLEREERDAAKLELKLLHEEKRRLEKVAEQKRRSVVVLKVPDELKGLVAASRDWTGNTKTAQRAKAVRRGSKSCFDNTGESCSDVSSDMSGAMSSDDSSSESSAVDVSDEEFNELSVDDFEDDSGDDDDYEVDSPASSAKKVYPSRLVVKLRRPVELADATAVPLRHMDPPQPPQPPSLRFLARRNLSRPEPTPAAVAHPRTVPDVASPPSWSVDLKPRTPSSAGPKPHRELVRRRRPSHSPEEPNAKRFLMPPKSRAVMYEVHVGKGTDGLCIDFDVMDGKSVKVMGFRRPRLGVKGPAEACGKISIGDELVAIDGNLVGGPAGFKAFVPLLKSGLSVNLRFRRPSS